MPLLTLDHEEKELCFTSIETVVAFEALSTAEILIKKGALMNSVRQIRLDKWSVYSYYCSLYYLAARKCCPEMISLLKSSGLPISDAEIDWQDRTSEKNLIISQGIKCRSSELSTALGTALINGH
jgi:hypothetical protein